MINIVLFDEESIIRVATKAINYFSSDSSVRITEDTIWVNGLYLRFYSKLITMNVYSPIFSKDNIQSCLSYILSDEEVFISITNQKMIYIDTVNAATNFDIFFCEEVV